ncbi:MAG TPA: cobalt ECF transporter T component CbiQ [Solirubrobacteraceae bacterium]
MSRPATPGWLLQGQAALCPCGCIGRRRRAGFLSQTLEGATRVLREAIFNEEVAARRGLLQRLDPRVKLVSLVAMLVMVGLVEHVAVLLGLYAATIALVALSRLPLAFFLKRVWLFVPAFTAVVVLPGTLSFVTHGQIVVGLGHWLGHDVGLTRQGLGAAALVIARVASSTSLAILLTLTTPWPRLLAALRALLAPRLFVLVVGMAYRFLFTLSGTVTDMYEARRARAVANPRDVRQGRRFVAASAGSLFGKAYALSEEVHQAMVARGFRGEARVLDRFRLRHADLVWTLAVAAAMALTFALDRGPVG